jgi:hypothetical protein
MTFEEFEIMWNEGGAWHQRGRSADSLLMTRNDSGLPWSNDNCYIEQRRRHLQQQGRMKRGFTRGAYKTGKKKL